MLKRKAIFLAPLAIATASVPPIWMGSASANGTGSSGIVHIYQVDNTEVGNTGYVVLTGAIGDWGTDGEGTGINGTNELNLQLGTIGLDLTDFGRSQRPTTVNESNCSYTSEAVGTISIVPNPPSPQPPVNTGKYAGVSGSFQVKATFAGTVPLHTVNGVTSCDFSQVNTQKSQLDFAEATGVVSGL